jgi:hypothetical protein
MATPWFTAWCSRRGSGVGKIKRAFRAQAVEPSGPAKPAQAA